MKQSQRIVKNAVVGIAAGVIAGVVYLVTTIALARNGHVSLAEFGEYQWVLAFAMIAQLVADSGLPRMMIREIAKDPECTGSITGASQGLIWFISFIVFIIACVVSLFIPYGTDVKISVILMTCATLATFHSAGYSAVLRAFEDNELNYIGFILQKVLLLTFILIALHYQTGLIGFVCCHFLSNVLLWNFNHILVAKFYTKIKLRVDLPLWKSLFFSSIPIGGGVMLRSLAMQIDIFVLGLMTSMNMVGLFGGPYRLSWTLRTIPQTLALPLYPLYSRTAHLSPDLFREAYQRSLKFFAILSVPFTVFFIAFSKPILHVALGNKFTPALPAMQWLGLGLFPFFLSTLFQYLFAALDEQKRFLYSAFAASVIRVSLLVYLIPRLGLVGPAIAFVCAETVIVSIWLVQFARLGYPPRLMDVVVRPFAAGACMAVILYLARDASIVLQFGAAAISVLVYFAALITIRTFTVEEVRQAKEGAAFISPFIESWSKKLKNNS